MLYLFITVLSISEIPFEIETVKCYQDDSKKFILDETSNKNLSFPTECSGDVCVMAKAKDVQGAQYVQTCLRGVNVVSSRCELDYLDNLVCYCNTDYCNNRTILTKYEIVQLPILECRSIYMKEFVPVSCNWCVRSQQHERMLDFDGKPYFYDMEEATCQEFFEVGTVMYRPSYGMQSNRMYHNFFPNACYNVTLSQNYQWSMFCRCNTTNCNDPLEPFPYPITAPSSVKCQTGGLDYSFRCPSAECYDMEQEMKNFTESDEFSDGECHGHICFIAKFPRTPAHSDRDFKFFKGCISANEQGPQKIQMGHSRFRDVEFYFCDSDYCNSDVETALESAKNHTPKLLQREKSTTSRYYPIQLFLLTIFMTSLYPN